MPTGFRGGASGCGTGAVIAPSALLAFCYGPESVQGAGLYYENLEKLVDPFVDLFAKGTGSFNSYGC